MLLQEDLKGKVFNKGVFVTLNEDLMWGYNLCTTLNRDRNIIDTYDLRLRINFLIADILAQGDKNFALKLAIKLLAHPDALEAVSGYNAMVDSEVLKDALFQAWDEKHGDALPVEDEADAVDVRLLGKDPVITSTAVTAVLHKTQKYNVEAIKASMHQEPRRIYKLRMLDKHEYQNLLHAIKVLKPAKNREMMLQVVDFPMGANVKAVWNDDTATIYVSKTQLNTRSKAIYAIATGLCAARDWPRSVTQINSILLIALEA